MSDFDDVEISKALLTANEFINTEFPLRQVILDPWLKERSIILISAFPGIGKTWFAFSLCDAITRNGSFGPWETVKPVNCLYIESEMDTEDTQERLQILTNSAFYDSKDYKIRIIRTHKTDFLILSDAHANNLGIPKAKLSNEYWRDEIKDILLTNNIKLVVFDNISSLTPGIDEISKMHWDPINQWLIELRFNGITSILIHHFGKSGTQRGTSARIDNLDISITLERPDKFSTLEDIRFICHFEKIRPSIPHEKKFMVADMEFELVNQNLPNINQKLTQGQNPAKSSAIYWKHTLLGYSDLMKILNLIASGMKQKEIAKVMVKSEPYISKVKSIATEKGLISPEGALLIQKTDYYRLVNFWVRSG